MKPGKRSRQRERLPSEESASLEPWQALRELTILFLASVSEIDHFHSIPYWYWYMHCAFESQKSRRIKIFLISHPSHLSHLSHPPACRPCPSPSLWWRIHNRRGLSWSILLLHRPTQCHFLPNPRFHHDLPRPSLPGCPIHNPYRD